MAMIKTVAATTHGAFDCKVAPSTAPQTAPLIIPGHGTIWMPQSRIRSPET